MKKGTLFKRIYLTTVISVFLCMAIIVTLLCISVSNILASDKRELLSENCSTVSTLFSQTVGKTSYKSTMPNVVYVLSKAIDADIFLVDTGGDVFLCSCDEWMNSGSCEHSKVSVPPSITSAAQKGEYYDVGNMSRRYSATFYTYGEKLCGPSGDVLGYVFASSPASNLTDFLTNIVKIFLLCSIVPMIIMFIVIFATSYRMMRPLQMMKVASKAMANGDFSKRIPVYGNDEISELAASFNSMTDSLVKFEGTRRSFVANVSHELRTPMTTIGGFIDGILDGTVPPERQSYYLEIVSSEVKRLARLVKSMLSLSQLESGSMELNLQRLDLVGIVGNTLVSQQQIIEEKGVRIEGMDGLDPFIINADADLLQQVFYNLLDNALKFTNSGGTITFNFKDLGAYTSVSIRNTGDGIPEDDIKYIFDRFYKADKSRSANKNSTGLGLYIVKTIIDIHSGNITVRSKPGEFAEFDIRLPKRETVNEIPENTTETERK